MKTLRSNSASRIPLACALAALITSAAALPDPNAPSGVLGVQTKHVRTGSKVQLTWQIIYPSKVDDLVTMLPGGGFQTNQDLDITVHAIGMEYQTVKSNNGHGNNVDGVDVSNPGRGRGGPNGAIDRSGPIDDERKLNGNAVERAVELDATLWIAEGGAWRELFQGGASQLTGGPLYSESSLPMGTTVDIAAQGKSRRGSNDVVSTASPSPNLIALKDGDPLPSDVGAFRNDTIANFLTPYVNDGHISLGPLQIIYLFDLDSTPGASSFDLQDLGVLVSVKPNPKRTVPTNRPEISQFNGGRRPGGNDLPRGNDPPRGSDQPRGNNSPGSTDSPGSDSNPVAEHNPGGGANPGTTHTPGSTNNQSSSAHGSDAPRALALHQMIYLVDVEAVLKEFGLTLQELDALLRGPSTEKREALLQRIQELGLFKNPNQLRDPEGTHPKTGDE